MIHLRGHHLFCMTLFTGHGYDERFTENMRRHLEDLKKAKDSKTLLVAEDDSICAACSNLVGSCCALGDEDVKARDRHARETLSLECGRIYANCRSAFQLSQKRTLTGYAPTAAGGGRAFARMNCSEIA